MADNISHEITNILDNPQLANNLRSQLKQFIQLLALFEAKQLAQLYLRHAFDMLIESNYEYGIFLKKEFSLLIEVKRFLDIDVTGNTETKVIKEIEDYESMLFMNRYDLQRYKLFSVFNKKLTLELNWLIIKTLQFCYLGDSEKSKPLGNPPDLFFIATSITRIIAINAGGEDWYSSDKEKNRQAKKIGNLASQKETQWQINTLLEFVDYENIVSP